MTSRDWLIAITIAVLISAAIVMFIPRSSRGAEAPGDIGEGYAMEVSGD